MKHNVGNKAARRVAILLAVLLLTLSIQPVSSDYWPVLFHDNQRTGNTTSTAPDTNAIVWTAPKSVGGNGYASPVIANDKVFVTRGVRVTCLYLENGTEIWSRDVQPASTASSSPTVAEGKVFVTGNRLYCFYENNGTDVWNVPLTGVRGTSSALAVNGKVYVNTQTLWCFDADDGTEIWNATVGGNGYSSPAYSKGRIFANGDNLYSFHAGNGTEIWNAPGGNGTSPVIANGKVMVKPLPLIVYYENNGTEVWRQTIGGEGYSTPAVSNGRIYLHDFDEGNDVFVLRSLYEENGTEIWRFGVHSEGCSSPVVSSDGKVIINVIGKTHCLDGSTGAEIWSYDTGGPGYSTPAISNGTVIVNQEIVYCFRFPNADYVLIRDAPGGKGNNLCDPANYPLYPADANDIFFGARYNRTAGYMDDVPVNSTWMSSNSSIASINFTGTSSALQCHETNIGTTIITLDDGEGHQNSTTVTVFGFIADYIQIRNASGCQGTVITSLELLTGETATLFCAAFNKTAGYFGDRAVNWTVTGSVGTLDPDNGVSTNFTATNPGNGIIVASLKGIIFNALITVNPADGSQGPQTPTGLQVRPAEDGGSLRLTWEAVSDGNLVGYNIYRSSQNGSGFELVNTEGYVTDISFLDTGLSDGTTFYYRVTAVDDSNNESLPSVIVGSTPVAEEEDGALLLMLLLIIIVVLVVLILLFALSKGRKSKGAE
jgi:outer membrane protein assembly factor BamB